MPVKRFKSIEELEYAWEEYKAWCDNQLVLKHDFSSKNSEFVSKELRYSITYTIEGFCVYIGISRASFYTSYATKKRYSDTVTRMKEECEIDARRKFETGMIPTQLAGLWMSNHGYSTKEKTIVASDQASNILDALNGQAQTVFNDPKDDDENE